MALYCQVITGGPLTNCAVILRSGIAKQDTNHCEKKWPGYAGPEIPA
jgi:hypothetical protein